MKFFKRSLNDIIYHICPPIMYKMLIRFSRPNNNKKESLELNKMLDELQNKRFNYFFDDSLIDDFCDSMRDNYINIQSLEAKNKNNQQYLNQLNDNGYVTIKNLFSKNLIKEWNKVLSPIIDKHVKLLEETRKNSNNLSSKTEIFNEDGLKVVHNIFDGVIRIWDVQKLIKSIDTEIINNKTINDICFSYLGNKTSKALSCYLDIKSLTGTVDSSTQPHADSVFKILKVFIPIEDIGYDNAPYLYFQGSHKPQEFKLLKDLIEYSQHNKKFSLGYGNYGLLSVFKTSENFPELKIKPKLVPSKAGDVIITDTNGIHAATNLISGRRVQLGLVFGIRGFHGGDIPLSRKLKSRNAV